MRALAEKRSADLLADHVAIIDELRSRGVLRSANTPTGDLAEFLFCKAFGWKREGNSKKSYDAVCPEGQRIQIKSRRVHHANRSRQLSAIRDLNGFDLLAGVLFDHSYKVARGILIPAKAVAETAKYVSHTNSYKFQLTDSAWMVEEAQDVTSILQAVNF